MSSPQPRRAGRQRRPDADAGRCAGPSGTVSDTTPTFAFSANENATFKCSLDGSTPAACSSPLKVGPLGNGPHSFSVRATDVAGNQSVTVTRSFTVAPAPTTTTTTTTSTPSTGTGGGDSGSGGSSTGGSSSPTSTGTPAAPVLCPATAAAVTSLGMRPKAFRAATHGGSAAAAKGGATVSFATSAPGTVTFTVQRPTRRRKGHKRTFKRLRGDFTRPASGGTDRFRFTGRVAGKALKPGSYQLVATGPGGARTTAFRIIS